MKKTKSKTPDHRDPAELARRIQYSELVNTHGAFDIQQRKLVEFILQTCELPHLWPLEDKERIHFLRVCYERAQRIRETERLAQ